MCLVTAGGVDGRFWKVGDPIGAPLGPQRPQRPSVDRKGRKDRRMLLILVDGIVDGIVGEIVDYRQLSVVDDDVSLYVLENP